MTFLQHEPSAHAPCTRTIAEFGGNSPGFIWEACEAAASAPFCTPANLLREPSSAIPRDAAVTVSRNLRRFIPPPLPSPRPNYFLNGRRHSRRESLSWRRQFRQRASLTRNAPCREIEPSLAAGLFEKPPPLGEGKRDRSCPIWQVKVASICGSTPEISDRAAHSTRSRET